LRKLVWFSNCIFQESSIKATGTWVVAMGRKLQESGECRISNFAVSDVDEISSYEQAGIQQWLLPRSRYGRPESISRKDAKILADLVERLDPDLVHIWGTENFCASLAADRLFGRRSVLLDIQGLLHAYADVFFGDLTVGELLGCVGPKEAVIPKRHLYFRQRDFRRRGELEKKVVQAIPDIAVQSEWVRFRIEGLHPSCRIHPTGILLRPEFRHATPWKRPETGPVRIFTSSSGAHAYKGIHVVLRAFAEVRKRLPSAVLAIAGNIRGGRMQEGYSRWLDREAERLGVADAIEWMGALSAPEIVQAMRASHVVVVPSFVETYCLALAEAMMVGVPTVVSYAGAMPELARDGESALYFPPGDSVTCAGRILRLVHDQVLAEAVSAKSRDTALIRNDPDAVARRQIEIYDRVREGRSHP